MKIAIHEECIMFDLRPAPHAILPSVPPSTHPPSIPQSRSERRIRDCEHLCPLGTLGDDGSASTVLSNDLLLKESRKSAQPRNSACSFEKLTLLLEEPRTSSMLTSAATLALRAADPGTDLYVLR